MKPVWFTLGILALMGISWYSGWAVGRSGVAPAVPAAQPAGIDPDRVFSVDIGDAPALGPASAPVTIVEFSDFLVEFSDCPAGLGITP